MSKLKGKKKKRGLALRVSPTRLTCALYGVFVVLYVLVVGTRYGVIFRMIEANSWTDEYFCHLCRYPYLGALMYALPMALAGLVFCLFRLRKYAPLTLLVPLFLAYYFAPHLRTDEGSYRLFSAEMEQERQVCNYILMADDKQWDELQETLRRDGNMDTPLGMRYALLAESALGRLPDALFRYPVHSPDDLLFRGDRSAVSCQFNRQFYENLGVYDEAFHQAMEYGVKQKGGCCLGTLRHLADYALASGDWQVAEKYLTVLADAWLQGDFVEQRRTTLAEVREQRLQAEARQDSTLLLPLRGESFVGLYPLRSEMVRLAYYEEGDSQKAVDYLLCIALLEKNLDTFYNVLTEFPHYQQRVLPQCYQQAIDILQSQGMAWRDASQGSYAYYFYNVAIPDGNNDMQMSSIN
ncbi:MAG: hypothetical protein KBT39_06915 [Bacteroidales bacterium]|nr:hypothetical protein [Bacteroidales bacterium]